MSDGNEQPVPQTTHAWIVPCLQHLLVLFLSLRGLIYDEQRICRAGQAFGDASDGYQLLDCNRAGFFRELAFACERL